MIEDFIQRRSAAPADHTRAGAPLRRDLQFFLASLLAFAAALSAQQAHTTRNFGALSEAQRLLQQSEPRQAIEVLGRNGKTIDPLTLHLLLGTAYTLIPDIREARNQFDNAVRIAPRAAFVHKEYGLSLMSLGDLSGARIELLEAAQITPNDPDIHFNLALLEGRDNQVKSGVVEIRKAIALTSDVTRLRRYSTTAGEMEVLEQDWPAARNHFSRALALDPTQETSWAGLGYALEELGYSEEAVDALKRAITLNAEDSDAWRHLAEVEGRLGDCTAEANAYEHVDRLHPRDRSTLSHLAQSLKGCGRKTEAAEAIAQLKALVEQEISVGHQGLELAQMNSKAIEFEKHGDYALAERDYRQLTALDPQNPIFRRNLGLVLCRQSEWVEGLDELRQALALDPDDLESQKALNSALSVASHTQP